MTKQRGLYSNASPSGSTADSCLKSPTALGQTKPKGGTQSFSSRWLRGHVSSSAFLLAALRPPALTWNLPVTGSAILTSLMHVSALPLPHHLPGTGRGRRAFPPIQSSHQPCILQDFLLPQTVSGGGSFARNRSTASRWNVHKALAWLARHLGLPHCPRLFELSRLRLSFPRGLVRPSVSVGLRAKQ